MLSRSSRKIIIEAHLMVLVAIFGALFGSFPMNRVFHEGYGTNGIVVICALRYVSVYAINWAIIIITKGRTISNSHLDTVQLMSRTNG